MSVRLRNHHGFCKLPSGELVLGREEQCGLFLDDPRLSRRHARLVVGHDSLEIEDLGSVNGVHVNGTRISTTTACHHGDQLVIGPFTFEVDIEPDSDPPSRLVGSLLDSELSSDLEFEPSTDQHRTAADKANANATSPVPVIRPGSDPDHASDSHTGSSKIYGEPLTPNPADEAVGSTNGHPTTAIRRNPFSEVDEADKTPHASPIVADKPEDSERNAERNPGSSSIEQGPRLRPQSTPRVTAALLPRDHRSHIMGELQQCRGARLAAGILDLVTSQFLALALALPCLVGGYVVALARTGAGLDDGEPVLHGVATPASIWELTTACLSAPGLRAVPEVLEVLRTDFRGAFLVFFVGGTVAVLVWAMALIASLVAATMIKGAPFWHRRFGLEIKERRTGFYPSPVRSFLRWLMAGLLGWMSPLFIALAMPSPHDEITRCWIRRRTDKSST